MTDAPRTNALPVARVVKRGAPKVPVGLLMAGAVAGAWFASPLVVGFCAGVASFWVVTSWGLGRWIAEQESAGAPDFGPGDRRYRIGAGREIRVSDLCLEIPRGRWTDELESIDLEDIEVSADTDESTLRLHVPGGQRWIHASWIGEAKLLELTSILRYRTRIAKETREARGPRARSQPARRVAETARHEAS